jgi:soluble lytic murein transglycosylase-like protein
VKILTMKYVVTILLSIIVFGLVFMREPTPHPVLMGLTAPEIINPIPEPPVKAEIAGFAVEQELAGLVLNMTIWLGEEHADGDLNYTMQFSKAVQMAARCVGMDPAILMATAWRESRMDHSARSSVAVGAWQQVPRYSGFYVDECWNGSTPICRQPGATALTADQILGDLELAARVAARTIHYHTMQTDSTAMALARYNGGYNPGRQADRYADSILARIQ